MKLLRLFLILFLVVLTAYTLLVMKDHGANLFAVFFNDMTSVNWAGQFNLDFMGFLALSGLWVSWRHNFSGTGLLLGLLAFFGGMMFLCIYLLFVIQRAPDMATVLLGPGRKP